MCKLTAPIVDVEIFNGIDVDGDEETEDDVEVEETEDDVVDEEADDDAARRV